MEWGNEFFACGSLAFWKEGVKRMPWSWVAVVGARRCSSKIWNKSNTGMMEESFPNLFACGRRIVAVEAVSIL